MNSKDIGVGEVFPAISVDLALGAQVEDIDVDPGRLTTMLRRRGLSDEAISAYSVHISAAEPIGSTGNPLSGDYKDGTSTIYVPRRINNATAELKSRGVIAGPAIFDISSKAVSRSLSQSLTHELEHGVIDYEGGMPEVRVHERKQWHGFLKHYAGSIACGEAVAFLGTQLAEQLGQGVGPNVTTAYFGALLGVAIHGVHNVLTRDTVKSYLEDPAEQRARRSELNAPDDLVSVRLKIDESLRSHLASEH